MPIAPARCRFLRRAAILVVGAAGLGLGGCVERVVSITSTPPGALVTLNDREVGRTPVDVRFVHYGTFDVRLALEGYEPLSTVGDASPPVWDAAPLDFFAEVAPFRLSSRIEWHYDLEPEMVDPGELVERARELRGRLDEGEASGD